MGALAETYAMAGAAPLGDAVPDPASVRDDSPEFEQVRAEIAKLESLGSQEEVNWRALVIAAGNLLQSRSKDLLAISYLSRGLFELEGYAGLATALGILRDVIAQHWEAAFPPANRAKRRGNEIGWLIDKLKYPVSQRKPTDADRDAIYAIVDLIAEIDGALREKLEDNAPIFRELRDAVQGYRDQLAEVEAAAKAAQEAAERERLAAQRAAEQPQPSPDAAAPAPATPPATPAATATAPAAPPAPPAAPAAPVAVAAPSIGALGNEAEIKRAIRETQKAVYSIARALRAAKLSDPRPYAILRHATWTAVSQPPREPQVVNGAWNMPGPTPNQLAECSRMLQDGGYVELIERAENLFANPDAPANCFWLDGHRFTASALAALGPEYGPAKDAVLQALRYYLARFPGTLELRFKDGVAFADPQTKLWIQSEVTTEDAPGGAASGTAAGGEASGMGALRDAIRQARKLAAQGDTGAALSVFRDGLRGTHSGREAFAWHLEQARFCAEAGHNEIAAPLLEALREQADRFGLDEWDPDLSVEVIQLSLRTLAANRPTDASVLQALRARLARLDPVAALQALGKG